MIEDIPSKIQVQVTKAAWFKRSYQFIGDGNVIGQLHYQKSYLKKGTGNVQGKEFSIRRRGFWKHNIEIVSPSHGPYNMHVGVNWRGRIKVTDFDGNPYTLKRTSIWKNKWAWFDRYDRPIMEIRSKIFSRKNRGVIEIKYPEMSGLLFWIIVAWFNILCSESDSAAAASAA